MTPDIQILSIVQIALIGILVVIGMFFLWRKIQRLEQKVEALGGQMEHCMGGGTQVGMHEACCPMMGSAAVPSKPAPTYPTEVAYDSTEDDEDDDAEDIFSLNAEEEAIVQRMFQGGAVGAPDMSPETAATFMVFSPFGFNNAPTTASPIVEIHDTTDVADTATDTESVARPITKTKLSKMNVEQLKAYLADHQCPTDGTKKQLFERAIETITLHS